MKTWLHTDTHFWHKSMVERGFRPAGYENKIIAQWRRLVGPEDIVIHLGDVIFSNPGTLTDLMADLPGIKILVRGNHDKGSNGWYMRHGFTFVAQGILHGGVWLSHAPAMVLPSGAILNVHGHLHDNIHHEEPEGGWPEHCKLLAIENTDYAPVEFDGFVDFSPIRKMLIGA